jgi:3-methyladenine DNA glycosylase AlkD
MGGAANVVPKVVDTTDECIVALHHDILIQLWHKNLTEEGVRQVRRAVQSVDDQFQYVVVIVEPSATTPKGHARTELDALARLIAARPTAVVFEGQGFGAAAVRGTVVAITAATGGVGVIQAVSSIEQAARWLQENWDAKGARHLETGISAVRLRARASTIPLGD